jgi:hypothetical protein
MKGRNNGKKLMAVRIVAHAFEIIHLLSDQNPVQVCLFVVALLTHTHRLGYRFLSMLLSTPDHVKIPQELDRRVPSDVRLLTCLPSDE